VELEHALPMGQTHDCKLFSREFEKQCLFDGLCVLSSFWHTIQDAIDTHSLLHLRQHHIINCELKCTYIHLYHTHHHPLTVHASSAPRRRHHRLHLLHFLLPNFFQCRNTLSICDGYLHEKKQRARDSDAIENSRSPLTREDV
jgi:hypothetical protein